MKKLITIILEIFSYIIFICARLDSYVNQIFFKRKLKQQLLQLRFEQIKFEELSNQKAESDVIYGLTKGWRDYYTDDPILKKLFDELFVIVKGHTELEIKQFYGSNSGRSLPSKNLETFSYRSDIVNWLNEKVEDKNNWERVTAYLTKEIHRRPNFYSAYYFNWNRRWFFMNGDGSHSIAAIYRLAKDNNLEYKNIYVSEICTLDVEILKLIESSYHLFLIRTKDVKSKYLISEIFSEYKSFLQNDFNNKNFKHNYLSFEHEGCPEYQIFIICKNTKYYEIIYDYFKILENSNKAIDLRKII